MDHDGTTFDPFRARVHRITGIAEYTHATVAYIPEMEAFIVNIVQNGITEYITGGEYGPKHLESIEEVKMALEGFAEFSEHVEVRLERMKREADERRAQGEAQGYRGMRQQER